MLAYTNKKDNKAGVILRAPKSLKQLNCGNVLKDNLKLIDGRGGGRPDMAQGSGNSAKLDEFFTKTKSAIEQILGK